MHANLHILVICRPCQHFLSVSSVCMKSYAVKDNVTKRKLFSTITHNFTEKRTGYECNKFITPKYQTIFSGGCPFLLGLKLKTVELIRHSSTLWGRLGRVTIKNPGITSSSSRPMHGNSLKDNLAAEDNFHFRD